MPSTIWSTLSRAGAINSKYLCNYQYYLEAQPSYSTGMGMLPSITIDMTKLDSLSLRCGDGDVL